MHVPPSHAAHTSAGRSTASTHSSPALPSPPRRPLPLLNTLPAPLLALQSTPAHHPIPTTTPPHHAPRLPFASSSPSTRTSAGGSASTGQPLSSLVNAHRGAAPHSNPSLRLPPFPSHPQPPPLSPSENMAEQSAWPGGPGKKQNGASLSERRATTACGGSKRRPQRTRIHSMTPALLRACCVPQEEETLLEVVPASPQNEIRNPLPTQIHPSSLPTRMTSSPTPRAGSMATTNGRVQPTRAAWASTQGIVAGPASRSSRKPSSSSGPANLVSYGIRSHSLHPVPETRLPWSPPTSLPLPHPTFRIGRALALHTSIRGIRGNLPVREVYSDND